MNIFFLLSSHTVNHFTHPDVRLTLPTELETSAVTLICPRGMKAACTVGKIWGKYLCMEINLSYKFHFMIKKN